MTTTLAKRNTRRNMGQMFRTNSEIISLYAQHLRAIKRSDRTVDGKICLLNRLGHYLDPTPIMRATYDDLSGWQASFADNLTAGTVAGYVACLHVFYRWLVKPMRLLEISPAEDLVIPKIPEREARPMPEDAFALAISCCVDPIILTWLLLMRYAGLRCIEVSRLQRDDVITEKPCRLYVRGKGGHERMVPIAQELVDALMPWMRRQGHLFTRGDGRPYNANNVTNMVGDYLHGLGLPYTAHNLRHSFGTRGLEEIKDVRVIQMLLGHRSLKSTMIYTQPSQPEAHRLAALNGEHIRQHHRRGKG